MLRGQVHLHAQCNKVPLSGMIDSSLFSLPLDMTGYRATASEANYAQRSCITHADRVE
jgi:hypothetical protein